MQHPWHSYVALYLGTYCRVSLGARPSPSGKQRQVARLPVSPLLQLALVRRCALRLLLVLDVLILSPAVGAGRRRERGEKSVIHSHMYTCGEKSPVDCCPAPLVSRHIRFKYFCMAYHALKMYLKLEQSLDTKTPGGFFFFFGSATGRGATGQRPKSVRYVRELDAAFWQVPLSQCQEKTAYL